MYLIHMIYEEIIFRVKTKPLSDLNLHNLGRNNIWDRPYQFSDLDS